jgi:hypothetical protein
VKYFLIFSFLVTICIASCAGAYSVKVPPIHDCNWTIIIDDKFSFEEKTQILLALQDWKNNIPDINYDIRHFLIAEKYPLQDRTVHIHYGYTSDMNKLGTIGYTFYFAEDFSGSEVYINLQSGIVLDNIQLFSLRKVSEHEIGHAFGLDHVPASVRADIMNPALNENNDITLADIQRFYQIHPSCK